jgi:predicted nucleic acid-binding protein
MIPYRMLYMEQGHRRKDHVGEKFMGWIEDLYGKVIGLDTAPFIYYIEQNISYIDMLRLLFRAIERGEITVVTSVMTLLETLVQPVRKGDTKLADQYRDLLFRTKNLITVMPSRNIAEEAVQLRALHNFRAFDAVQVATAIDASASVFLTNDRQLQRASAIQVLVLDDLK